MKKILVVGAGGHCRVLISILSYYNDFDIIGIADRESNNLGEKIGNNVVKYSWDELEEIYQDGIRHAVIAVGDNRERKNLYIQLKKIGFQIPTIIHPKALIERNAEIKNGNVICIGAKIGTQVSIGNNCVIYTGAILDHEVKVEDNVYISPGCNIAGRVTIKDGAFIGIGCSIKENITIGSNSIIGAGSVIIEDVKKNSTVVGVPARIIK